jgi:hypothetical protein
VVSNEGRSEVINNVKVTTQRIKLSSAAKSERSADISPVKRAEVSRRIDFEETSTKTIDYNEIYNRQKQFKYLKVI